jgi:hypothetical protein
MTYVICGLGSALWFPFAGGRKVLKDWRPALPFAICWMAAMVLLFACFGLVGPVYGNISQATRGILSIILGFILARLGFQHLEKRIQRGVLYRRLAAAALMCTAIWLFKAGL